METIKRTKIVELLNGNGNVVELSGTPGLQATIDRGDVMHSVADKYEGIKFLANINCEYDQAKAMSNMEDLLQSLEPSEIDLIYTYNDAMALGALSAVEAAGFNTDGEESSKYIPIYGIDALPEILSKIESGEITGSVLQDAKTQGQTIVKMAENLTSGKDAVDGIEGVETEEEAKAVRVPYQAITKDNLDLAKSTYE